MAQIRVLHLIEGVSAGGACRNTLAMARSSMQLEALEHRIVSLMPASDEGQALANHYGVPLVNTPNDNVLMDEIERADIVQLNYWNCPLVTRLLNMQLPPMRFLIWFRILGESPPQVISAALLDQADVAVMTSPCSAQLPVCQDSAISGLPIHVVHGPADFDRVASVCPKPHPTFNVGYIGTVDFVKMHPDYVLMSTRVQSPDVRFIVCGKGATDDSTERYLKSQAKSLGKLHLFDFRGHVSDIASVIEELDVYGYPLCEETFATSEANLQEVMFAGVPPVVFPYGGVKSLVINHETGLVIKDSHMYAEAITYLKHHPTVRKRLGNNARAYAQRHFGAHHAAFSMGRIYQNMFRSPKYQRPPLLSHSISQSHLLSSTIKSVIEEPNDLGSEIFMVSLGTFAVPFYASKHASSKDERLLADREIASWIKSALMMSSGYGSVFHYSNSYPTDAYLHFWCGLLLLSQHKYCQAAERLQAACNFGCPVERVQPYLEIVIANEEQDGMNNVAKEAPYDSSL